MHGHYNKWKLIYYNVYNRDNYYVTWYTRNRVHNEWIAGNYGLGVHLKNEKSHSVAQ